MSLDQYHFHMVLHQERMTRTERLAADEQAARVTQALSEVGRAAARLLRRPERRTVQMMPQRRNA